MGQPYSSQLHGRWRTGRYVGAHAPRRVVKVQRGVLDRTYRPFTKLDGSKDYFGAISGSKLNGTPWQTFWRPTGPWIDVPNVSDVQVTGSFEDNGIATGTITVENVVARAIVGMVGTFHLIERGYLAPWFGWRTFGRPSTGKSTNEWFEVFNGGYRIDVWEGYGDALEHTFAGLIDESKITALPENITIVARGFGQAFTDQRVFGHNKAPELRSPVVFYPRNKADKVTAVGGSAEASSVDPAHPAKYVTITGTQTTWLSQGHPDPDVTEWVQVRVPKGRYESVFIDPHYDGMEVYLSIFGRGEVKVDGVPVDADEFISRGLGIVPGANGGHPYVKRWATMDKGGKSYPLGFTLECGQDTVFRVSFRKLGFSPVKRDYRAGCSRVAAMRRQRKPEAMDKKWVLIDDATDMVKWACMWAGFREWDVEHSGVNIKEPVTFHQSNFLIDIVNYVKEQGDFTFYVDRPSAHPDSIGVPVFRRTRALAPPSLRQIEVRDTDLLTGVEPSFTKEPLAFIIRVRGRMIQKGERGVALGEDSTKRPMAVYLPPWSGAHHSIETGQYDKDYPFANRLAGLLKHQVTTNPTLENEDECMMACVLIAMRMALAAFTIIIEIPAHPGISLDDQVSIIDTATGVNTRMWVGSIQTTHNSSDGYKMTLAGSMLDTPDILALAFDHAAMLRRVTRETSP